MLKYSCIIKIRSDKLNFKNKSTLGITLTLLGATCWGMSGTSAQYLQINQHINTEWLITLRLFTAGILTIIYRYFRRGNAIFDIFKNRRDFIKLLVFGIFGIQACQYTYFRTIIYAGAGIATVLQYLAPVFIIFYLFLFHRKLPRLVEIISVILSLGGTFIIAFQGTLDFSKLNENILFWGLLSAIAVAIYSMQPVTLLAKYGTGVIVGWGMIVGGIASLFIWQPLNSEAIINNWTFFNLFTVIVLGSALSFNLYLEGVRLIGAVRGTVLSSFEPISAAFISWLILDNKYSTADLIGFTMILLTIFILARSKDKG